MLADRRRAGRPVYPEVVEHADEIERVLKAEEERFRETLERGLREFEALAGERGDLRRGRLHARRDVRLPAGADGELAEERGQPVDVDGYRALWPSIARSPARAASAFDISTSTPRGAAKRVRRLREDRRPHGRSSRSRIAATAPSTRSSSSRRSTRRVGARSPTPATSSTRRRARAPSCRDAPRIGDDQVLIFRGEGFGDGDARARGRSAGASAFRRWRTTPGRIFCTRRCTRSSASTRSRRAPLCDPTSFASTSRTAQALTPEEREQVERLVNEKVFENLPVRTFVTTIDEARKLGAMMLFGEKYGDEVRVVEIEDYSRELCGGTHVRSTAEIGPFVILSEGSVGSGVRRIEAVTAGEAWALLRARARGGRRAARRARARRGGEEAESPRPTARASRSSTSGEAKQATST